MTDDNVLYLLADTSRYHEGKINVLTAQSHVLLSREHIKKIKELKASEKFHNNEIILKMAKLRTDVKKLKEFLPIKREKLIAKVHKSPEKMHQKPVRNEIRHELDRITDKLRELGVA